MGVDPPTADGPASVPATTDRPVAAAGPGLTREGRRAIAVGAFVAIFLGSLLLLADGVGVLAKLALALPLVVVGLTAGLAVVRPGDGWTAAARSSGVLRRPRPWPPPPFARLPIRRRFDGPRAASECPRPSAARRRAARVVLPAAAAGLPAGGPAAGHRRRPVRTDQGRRC